MSLRDLGGGLDPAPDEGGALYEGLRWGGRGAEPLSEYPEGLSWYREGPGACLSWYWEEEEY